MPTNRWRSLIRTVLLVLFFCPLVCLCHGQGVDPKFVALNETETIDLGEGVKMEFVLIRPGSFTMGSDAHEYDEKSVHNVTLTQPFYLGKYEVTQDQWGKVMGGNPSHFNGAKLPVENVSWHDCQSFLAAFQKKTGRRFALPTEAQWEYACRAGTTTQYAGGNDETNLATHAWYSENSELKTHPVGQKQPNLWGIHDMHGNVYEWCADWYSESYPNGDAVDPLGAKQGDRRIIRGGAWIYVPDNLRSSDRGFSPPDFRINEYGLRCVMPVGDAVNSTTQTEKNEQATSVATPALAGATLFSQLEATITEANKLQAEIIVAELETLVPGDSRLASLRKQVAALPTPKPDLVIDLGNGAAMKFVLIRPGSFTMGSDASPLDNEKPAHRVSITQPFYLGKYEVTQEQWESVMSRNLSVFKGNPPLRDASQLPVENVSWHLCQSFLAKLTEKFNGGYEFRLPTEAEWEYAARAGTAGGHSFGDGAALDDHAWYGKNSGGQTHPVGGKNPNPWGLYDMYGNVWEWCEDRYGLYSSDAVSDPVGPGFSAFAGARVLRGGAWNNTANHVNSSFRFDDGPAILMRYYGFRCVVEIAPKRKE